jgi:signal transduction histidine kinase
MSFLSHDLRGSLNGIMLMLEVLRREFIAKGESPEAVGDILLMRRSITDAVAMMERHVQADRLRRGRITPRNVPMDLKPVVDQVLSDLSAAASEKHLTIETVIPEGAMAQGDTDLVRQALHNLVDNAIRHGGGAVRVEAMREGDEWMILVSDRGPGMENERLRQWLDPVRRMEMKERGVGLQIAYHAARLMHGKLEGQAAPGHGVTLRLVLPAAHS